MRYKVNLTTEDGELLEQWNVVMTKAAQTEDTDFNLSKSIARSCFIGEVVENMERADLRALKHGTSKVPATKVPDADL